MRVMILSVQKYRQPQFFPVRFDFLLVKTGIYRSSGISGMVAKMQCARVLDVDIAGP